MARIIPQLPVITRDEELERFIANYDPHAFSAMEGLPPRQKCPNCEGGKVRGPENSPQRWFQCPQCGGDDYVR